VHVEVGPGEERWVAVPDVFADGDEHHPLGRGEVLRCVEEDVDDALDAHHCTSVRGMASKVTALSFGWWWLYF
jgi:hypothetical protein